MATSSGKSYEAIRKQRIQDNIKQLEILGISQISKCLLEVAKCETKMLKSHASPKTKKNFEIVELRRSSRARNQVLSYNDQVDEIDLRAYHKRSNRSEQNGREYTGRIASTEQRHHALQNAHKFLSAVDPSHPSFVKEMVRSHVSSCFWLGLPTKFCKEHLPPKNQKMVLEDEGGSECDSIYIAKRTGLSGGWRGFAMDHHLEDGDALVFELSKPTRFKIYIFKAIEGQDDEKIADMDDKGTNRSTMKDKSLEDSAVSPKSRSKRKRAAKD